MTYKVEFRPGALKDLHKLPRDQQQRIVLKISAWSNDLAGDVKRLTNFTPEYRLRVGDYRVLFDVESRNVSAERKSASRENENVEAREDRVVVVRRILHRKDAYHA